MDVLYGTGETRSPGHPHRLQKQQTPKKYAGEVAREPRKHKIYLMVSLGYNTDNTAKEHLGKENNKYPFKTMKTLS